jgi:hypothetical protein
LLSSVFVFTHAPAQTVPEQPPLRQQEPLAHTLPQAPQLLLSVLLSTHVGKPLTLQTSGRVLGHEQNCVQTPVCGSWLKMIVQDVAPTGQHIVCSPGLQPLINPQLGGPANVLHDWHVNVLPQTHTPFWQTSFWPHA